MDQQQEEQTGEIVVINTSDEAPNKMKQLASMFLLVKHQSLR